MKTNPFIYLLVGLLFMGGCKMTDDILLPSKKDKNYMVVYDEPGELNQLRYQIFKETKVPIFLNDTIAKEFRGFDVYGDSVFHYEILKASYDIDLQSDPLRTTPLKNDEDTKKALEMMRDFVIPNLPDIPTYRPYSYLMRDTILQKFGIG